jgi:hypothetical protein
MLHHAYFRRYLSLTLFVLLCVGAWGLRRSYNANLENGARTALDERWSAMKGFLRIESLAGRNRAFWYADQDDRDEARALAQIKTFYLLADKEGQPLEISPAYQAIDRDSPSEIRSRVKEALEMDRSAFWLSRRTREGKPFLIRAGLVYSERDSEPYYVAIGLPIGRQDHLEAAFTWALACVVACAMLLGWMIGLRRPAPDSPIQSQRIPPAESTP